MIQILILKWPNLQDVPILVWQPKMGGRDHEYKEISSTVPFFDEIFLDLWALPPIFGCQTNVGTSRRAILELENT